MNLSEIVESMNEELKGEKFGVHYSNNTNLYYIETPFCYPDGDGYALVISLKDDGTFVLHDHGYSLYHLWFNDMPDEEILTDKRFEALKRVAAKHHCTISEAGVISRELQLDDLGFSIMNEITNFICVIACVDRIVEFCPV